MYIYIQCVCVCVCVCVCDHTMVSARCLLDVEQTFTTWHTCGGKCVYVLRVYVCVGGGVKCVGLVDINMFNALKVPITKSCWNLELTIARSSSLPASNYYSYPLHNLRYHSHEALSRGMPLGAVVLPMWKCNALPRPFQPRTRRSEMRVGDGERELLMRNGTKEIKEWRCSSTLLDLNFSSAFLYGLVLQVCGPAHSWFSVKRIYPIYILYSHAQ